MVTGLAKSVRYIEVSLYRGSLYRGSTEITKFEKTVRIQRIQSNLSASDAKMCHTFTMAVVALQS